MDITPTIVQVKDIVILDDTNYGENVLIQVLGTETATAPLTVHYSKLKEFAEKVLAIELGGVKPTERPVVDTVEVKPKIILPEE